jgi:hypothetical protein
MLPMLLLELLGLLESLRRLLPLLLLRHVLLQRLLQKRRWRICWLAWVSYVHFFFSYVFCFLFFFLHIYDCVTCQINHSMDSQGIVLNVQRKYSTQPGGLQVHVDSSSMCHGTAHVVAGAK